MKAYKDIFYKYVTLAVAGAVTIGILFGHSDFSQYWLVAILVAWLVGNAVYWQHRATSRKKTLDGLYQDCDMSRYIEEYQRLDARSPRMSDPQSKNDIKLNLAAGLYAHGDYDEMKQVLSGVTLSNRTSQQDLAQQVAYHSDMALYQIERNDFDEAERELDSCYEIMNNIKFKEPQLSASMQVCESAMALINMREGELEGVEDQFRTWLESGKDNMTKVSCSYWLGEICWHQGREDEAKEFFTFAAEKGGDTTYGEKARAILNRKGNQSVKLSIPG